MLFLANMMSDPTVDDIIKLTAISGGIFIAVVAVIFGSVAKMVRSSNMEKTRREISAYVAEGSMTPEEGERLLNAGRPFCGGSKFTRAS